MRPYEIRQRSDGSIDYDNYHARPIALPRLSRQGMLHAAAVVRTASLLVAGMALLAVFNWLTG